MDLIIDPGQIGHGRALSHPAEFVVDGAMAEANPALVRAKVGHRNAAQVRANSGSADDTGVAGVRDGRLRLFVELRGRWERIGLIDL